MITMRGRGMIDDKVICSRAPFQPGERIKCKGLVNFVRRRPGRAHPRKAARSELPSTPRAVLAS